MCKSSVLPFITDLSHESVANDKVQILLSSLVLVVLQACGSF